MQTGLSQGRHTFLVREGRVCDLRCITDPQSAPAGRASDREKRSQVIAAAQQQAQAAAEAKKGKTGGGPGRTRWEGPGRHGVGRPCPSREMEEQDQTVRTTLTEVDR